MKRTDFTMLLIDTSGEGTWTEDISCVLSPDESALDRARKIIADYNAYLAPYEFQRRVVSVRVLKEPKPNMYLKHDWKKINKKSDQQHEEDCELIRMKCTQCGATGIKRRAGFTVVDRKYIKYEFSCPNEKVNI